MPSLWLRSETKANERRTPLTPKNAKKLVDMGIKVYVEEFPDRIFPISDYQDAGCEIVKEHSWKEAPVENNYILGLKELLEEDFPLKHKHIYFAHVFKGQNGYKETLSRYKKGEGVLFDLEYLTDINKRRIAAFGFWAGFVGAAIGVRAYVNQVKNGFSTVFSEIHSVEDKSILIDQIKKELSEINNSPRSLIIGSSGRCGSGAQELFKELGIETTCWDRAETSIGGPFKEISDHEIFVNTVLVTTKIPPFVDQSIFSKDMKLKVIADVSCDPTSDLNPIPIYDDISNWQTPMIKRSYSDSQLEVLAVDNLPSLLPKESSEDFSDQLFPHLVGLLTEGEKNTPWKNAFSAFSNALNF